MEMVECAEREDEAFSNMAEVSDYEPGSSDLEYDCTADVGERDSASLHKYFLVEGSMLMSLFRFCPECGHRLRKAQLKAVGTAAVVWGSDYSMHDAMPELVAEDLKARNPSMVLGVCLHYSVREHNQSPR
ncbi:hypothetical protein OSTOST_12679 [Ostertagia ostertagi]